MGYSLYITSATFMHFTFNAVYQPLQRLHPMTELCTTTQGEHQPNVQQFSNHYSNFSAVHYYLPCLAEVFLAAALEVAALNANSLILVEQEMQLYHCNNKKQKNKLSAWQRHVRLLIYFEKPLQA